MVYDNVNLEFFLRPENLYTFGLIKNQKGGQKMPEVFRRFPERLTLAKTEAKFLEYIVYFIKGLKEERRTSYD